MTRRRCDCKSVNFYSTRWEQLELKRSEPRWRDVCAFIRKLISVQLKWALPEAAASFTAGCRQGDILVLSWFVKIWKYVFFLSKFTSVLLGYSQYFSRMLSFQKPSKFQLKCMNNHLLTTHKSFPFVYSHSGHVWANITYFELQKVFFP